MSNVFSWFFLPENPKQNIEKLSNELVIQRELAVVLLNRDVKSFSEAKSYFRPNFDALYSPLLMKNMQKASLRLVDAVNNNQKVLVYGDYDVDGTTSVAMMSLFLEQFLPSVDTYIPDRYKEGYGVSEKGVETIISNQYDLVITLDCGIKSVKLLSQIQANDIDVIVCDHHEPGNDLPDIFAVLDPKQKDCNYPFKELSGCGVGFKLIQQTIKALKLDDKLAHQYLDLLCLSIAADIVPITSENRILAAKGLSLINDQPRLGLDILLDENKKGVYTISDLVFGVAPKINAAGRITHAKYALQLLKADSTDEAKVLAKPIFDQNQYRRELDQSILEEALEMIEKQENTNANVLYHKDWNKGVIGIVASRVIEHSYKPTIIFTKSSDSLLAASARSVNGFNLYKALEQCSDLIEQFGGHAYAAGLVIKEENFNRFSDKFNHVVGATIKDSQKTPTLEIDCKIELKNITQKFIRVLMQMEPFGPKNSNPVFLTEKLILNKPPTFFGSENQHVRLDVIQENAPEIVFQAIGFNLAEDFKEINSAFDLVFSIRINYWKSREYTQLMIKDFKPIP